jgi:acetyl esterase/lipase
VPALRVRLEAAEKRLAAGQSPANPQNLALLRFKIEQAQLLLNDLEQSGVLYSTETQGRLAAVLGWVAAIERARGDAALLTTSRMHERAYIAAADGSAQPYWVFVPRGYTTGRKYPLVVYLHGYEPSITKATPWIPGEETWGQITGRGFLLAVPYGRRNTDFLGVGEDDTLTVTSLVQKQYSIDESRIFLMGASMGGYGTYAIGLHHPHLWAALAALAARSDIYLWLNLKRDEVEPWKLSLYESDDPRHLKANALHLPIFMLHGTQDNLVDVAHSRAFFADLKALGYPARFREIAELGHYIYLDDASYGAIFNWMRDLRRTTAPRRVVYSTSVLRNHRAYWVDIEAFEEYGQAAHIEAEIQAGGVVAVTTTNIASFTLRPPTELLAGAVALTLRVNGAVVATNLLPGQPIHWGAAVTGQEAYPGSKTPQRCGPIRDCYRDPFLLVYGTLQANGGVGRDEANARRFAHEWERCADGVPPLRADHEVTAEDRRRYNLVLFGTRESNSVLASVADRLPVELTPTGYRIGDRNVSGENLGLALCYPSPFDERRMIVVQSGHYWGDALAINHKFDLQPDYIVYTDAIDASDGTNRALAADFFDNHWQLQSARPSAEQNGENGEQADEPAGVLTRPGP